MRQFTLSLLFLILSGLPLLAQGDSPVAPDPKPPRTHPRNVGPPNRDFISPAQRRLLNYQQFGARVDKFLDSWEKWALVHNSIVQSSIYDRNTFVREEKCWRGVTKRMRYLVKSRLSKGYLLAAGDLKQEQPTGFPTTIFTTPRTGTVDPVEPPPPRRELTAIDKNRAPTHYEILREYFALQPKAAEFTSHWIDWLKVHAQLMRAEAYDYLAFKLEAELWKSVTLHMDELKSMRSKNAFVEPGNKR